MLKITGAAAHLEHLFAHHGHDGVVHGAFAAGTMIVNDVAKTHSGNVSQPATVRERNNPYVCARAASCCFAPRSQWHGNDRRRGGRAAYKPKRTGCAALPGSRRR